MSDRRTILILSANPKSEKPLRLGEEIREIKRLSESRDLYKVETAEAVRVRDIREVMFKYRPKIVHFCGHGEGEKGLVFEDEMGQAQLVGAEALADLFCSFADELDCVLLNTCYSEVQAQKISQYINHVIGMSQKIGDRAAIEFAVGFYMALGAGETVESCYKHGCNAINMQGINRQGIPEHLTPELLTKNNITKPEKNMISATIESKNAPPLPVADLETPGGTILRESKFYVEREPWERCCQEIERKAGLIQINAPQQMGKTSLLTRIRNHAIKQGYQAITLDFAGLEKATFESSSIFLKRFCALVSLQLGISQKKVTEFWEEDLLGPKENCSNYIEQYILTDLTSPLFLGIDELDRLFPYDQVAKEFLILLRAWNGNGRVKETWSKLRMVITHSTESYVVMSPNSSPFNVGLMIGLSEFTSFQILDLAARHGLNWETGEVEQLMTMVGGYPSLVRLSLHRIAQGDLTLTELLAKAPTDAGLFREHLRQHLWNLQQYPDLAHAFHQVIFSDHPVILEPILALKLVGMGLVNQEGDQVILRHDRLYRPYFRSRLSLRP